jgi:hypothetical protein
MNIRVEMGKGSQHQGMFMEVRRTRRYYSILV